MVVTVMVMMEMMTLIIISRPKSESVENHANEGEEVDGEGGRLVPVGSVTSQFHLIHIIVQAK